MRKPYSKLKAFPFLTPKKSDKINYKNIILLRKYITVSGKIIPRRLNNLTTKQQRYISKAIKNSRYMSFLPFIRLSTDGGLGY